MVLGVIFIAVGLLIIVASVVVLYFRRKARGKTDLMRNTQTTDAASVVSAPPGTLVEVKGTLRCREPVTGELSGRECAYAITQIIREYEDTDYDSDGHRRTQRRTEVMASNENIAPFFVEDESGEVEVRAQGAEVDAVQVVDRFEREVREGGFSLGGFSIDLGGDRDRTLGYRHTESILPFDAPVYVLGAVGPGGIIQEAGEGSEETTFVISYRSEEQLEKKYKKDALVLGLVAAGLFVFGLIFVAVGAGAALFTG